MAATNSLKDAVNTATNGQTKIYTSIIEYDPKSKMLVASVIGLSGAHTQAASLDELRIDLREVIDLCLEDAQNKVYESVQFVGLMQVKLD